MLPPPDDFSSDDEDMMRDDEDTDALADVSETHVDFCYPVNTPVRAPPLSVKGDQAQLSLNHTLPANVTQERLTLVV